MGCNSNPERPLLRVVSGPEGHFMRLSHISSNVLKQIFGEIYHERRCVTRFDRACRQGPQSRRWRQPAAGHHLSGRRRRGAVVRRLQHLFRYRRHRRPRHIIPALYPAFRRTADRARFRVRQRLSRHRQCRRHGDLYPLIAGQYRRGVVRHVQPVWRLDVLGRGGLRHRLAIARRTDLAGRQRRGVRHGVRPADRRHYLECGHLVVRAAGIEFAHPDRINHGRWHRQCLLRGRDGTSGVDWSQAASVGKALLLSPLFGFALAALLLFTLKLALQHATPALFAEPKGDQPPPAWIRGILILTCTLVSFFHGSNDGQKGMGLIMLILIGTVPTAYALNRAMPASQIEQFVANSQAASAVIGAKAVGFNVLGDPRPAVTAYVAQRQINEGTFPSLAALVNDIARQVTQYGSIAKMPSDQVGNTRNDMYLASEAIRFLVKDKESDLNAQDISALNAYKGSLDSATKFIPGWVKIVVAIALGLGTMVGWKRIVVTVGEKIGKTHLTYAQGACAEITAAATIAAADGYGLPVSTTHVLSSGIAGTMAANGSGLQMATIRNIVLAWVLTLPAAMTLSGTLYFIFSHLF